MYIPQARRTARVAKKRERSSSPEWSGASGDEAFVRLTRAKRLRAESHDDVWVPGRSPSPAGGGVAASRVKLSPALPPGPVPPVAPPSPVALPAARPARLGWPLTDGGLKILPPSHLQLKAPAPLLLQAPAPLQLPLEPPIWQPPSRLHDVHLASDPLFRHSPYGKPPSAVHDVLMKAGHLANTSVLYTLLSHVQSQLVHYDMRAFGQSYESLEAPTLEQVEAMNAAELQTRAARLHAIAHVVLGPASALEKRRALCMLSDATPELLADVRVGELNLRDLATITDMPDAERAELMYFFRRAGLPTGTGALPGTTPPGGLWDMPANLSTPAPVRAPAALPLYAIRRPYPGSTAATAVPPPGPLVVPQTVPQNF